ncbi:hypothetical protein [Iningainema tapete]|uniref:Uncharacterized protein n=1 Tax=Iningainema tapete BLCC-T55 TaxID=2748662 RepID=A0A8J6XYQ7_9CYAN|nr:hypothetical protein [Iningainema tapete]MBD2775558.1 hypothetical protein [Iningainema tapete BLCC-T55]
MTKDKIPSEPPLNSSNTPTVHDSQNNASNWESRMARLVGLEEESHSSGEATTTRQPLPEPEEPQSVQSRSPLSSNPFAKLGLVGAGTLALIVFAGVFLTLAMNIGNQKPKPNPNLVVQPRSQPTTKPTPELQQEEIEALKTKLALAEQAQAVQLAQRQLRNQKSTPTPRITTQPTRRPEPPRVVYRDRPSVVAQRIPTPVQTVYLPAREPVKRPQPQPTRITQLRREPPRQVATVPRRTLPPVLPPLQPSQPIPTPPPLTPTPSSTPDPMQEWARLAKLGSYGQVPGTKNQGVNNATIAQANTIPAPQPLTVTKPPIRVINPPSPSPVSTATKQNSKSAVVGSTAKAVLVTAVYGETTPTNRSNTRSGNNSGNNNSDSGNKEVFVARLTEPLKAADGTSILPKDTQIYLNNDSTSDSGLMRLNVIKVSWQEKNGNRVERNIPEGSLVIRGSNGQPTVGEQNQISTGGSRLGSDIRTGIFSGINKGAEYVNRPRQECDTLPYPVLNGNTNPNENNSQNTITYRSCYNASPDPSIAAGFVEGITRSIGTNLEQRSRASNVPRPPQRTNLWVLSAGKQVVLFVNQPIQL